MNQRQRMVAAGGVVLLLLWWKRRARAAPPEVKLVETLWVGEGATQCTRIDVYSDGTSIETEQPAYLCNVD